MEGEAVRESWSDNSAGYLDPGGCERVHDRYEWDHWVHVCWVRRSFISEPLVVGTADLSAGGIGLLCPNLVYPGTVGLVLLVGREQRLKLNFIEIVHCRYLVGSMLHLVGARWIRKPPGLGHVRGEMTATGPRIVAGPSGDQRSSWRRRRVMSHTGGPGIASAGED